MDATHERVRQLCINEQNACEPSWLEPRRVLTGCMACESRVLAHECVVAALLNLSLLHSCLLWLPTDCLVGWLAIWPVGWWLQLVGLLVACVSSRVRQTTQQHTDAPHAPAA